MKMTINVDGYGVCHVESVNVDDGFASLHARIALPTRVDDLGIPCPCDCGDGCDECDVTTWDLYLTEDGFFDAYTGDDMPAECRIVDAYHVEDDRQLTEDEIREAVAMVAAAFAPEGV
jgi:hypothetical protein